MLKDDLDSWVDFRDRINRACNIAFQYGQIEGGHHRLWVIDQMLRELLKDEYEQRIRYYEYQDQMGDEWDEDDVYEWDTGISP